MRKILIILSIALSLILAGCDGLDFGKSDFIRLYISIGVSTTTLPGTVGVDEQAEINNYWGKTVRFSVTGDNGDNTDIDLAGSGSLDWTGSDPESGTQYTFWDFNPDSQDITYSGGWLRFRFYIDWNNSGDFDAGDVYMGNYSFLADKDNDPDTDPEPLAGGDLDQNIVYNEGDHSVSINDPMTYNSGYKWKITSIFEGDLLL